MAKQRTGRNTKFKKGDPKPPNSGRVKGTPNKWPGTFKKAMMLALEHIGDKDELSGVDYLVKWARRSPKEFYRIAGRMLPREIEISGKADGAPINTTVIFGGRFKPQDGDSQTD